MHGFQHFHVQEVAGIVVVVAHAEFRGGGGGTACGGFTNPVFAHDVVVDAFVAHEGGGCKSKGERVGGCEEERERAHFGLEEVFFLSVEIDLEDFLVGECAVGGGLAFGYVGVGVSGDVAEEGQAHFGEGLEVEEGLVVEALLVVVSLGVEGGEEVVAALVAQAVELGEASFGCDVSEVGIGTEETRGG